MNITVVNSAGEEVKPQESRESSTVPVITGDLLNQSVGQMFNMRPGEIEAAREKIKLLVDYAKTITDDYSAEGIKWAIRSLQSRVGTPPLGEKWLSYLTKYAYIKLESEKLKKEVEKYEHNN